MAQDLPLVDHHLPYQHHHLHIVQQDPPKAQDLVVALQILAVTQEEHPVTYTCSSRRHRSLPTCFCTPPGINQSTLSQVKLLAQNLVLFISYL